MAGQKAHSRENEPRESNYLVRRFATRLHSIYRDLAAVLEGIEEADLRLRYASLLFYRLIFLYFLQHMDLLAGDPRYLQHRLRSFQDEQEYGSAFYRDFLRPLFAHPDQPEDCRVSFANPFTSRAIEQAHPAISIPDRIFAQIFTFFDEYSWQPCDRNVQNAREITPEILGTLFEQEMNPKEMGAYYTPGEVTAYITRNTLLSALFTRVQERCGKTCTSDTLLWQCLQQQPRRYLFAAAYKGYERPLPSEIAAGIQDIARREHWQESVPEAYALPGETWREVIARRACVDEILFRLNHGSAADLDRLVTWNLNQQLLTLDTLRSCRQPEFLQAYYQSLRQLTILDPTCGSGAFLCAALPQLESLYAACLGRMEEMCAPSAPVPLAPLYARSFHAHLEEVGDPVLRPQSILYWIIEHNLYGVDLAEEAVEICRLRLCLKGLAALPDCALVSRGFGQHIQVGNTLVGELHANPGEQLADTDYRHAFHWGQAFPEVMGRGGFDVVFGNPPYVEYERVRRSYTVDGYATMVTGNLYALTLERCLDLLAPGGRFGMIVPASASCTDGYRSLQKLLLAQQELHIASFSDQRGRLFALPHPRLCIIFYKKPASSQPEPGRTFTTSYIKLGEESRSGLFEHLYYTEVTQQVQPGIIPRYSSSIERDIFGKLCLQKHRLGDYLDATGAYSIYYTRKLSWFVQVTPFVPLILDALGNARRPSELKTLRFASRSHALIAFTALNSNLFYWLITTGSDCRNLNMREVLGLPLDVAQIHPVLQKELCQLSQELESDLRTHARMRSMVFQGKGSLTIQCLYPARSKCLIDEIDRVLARHYDFSAAELDFLLHYDEQYRQPPASRVQQC